MENINVKLTIFKFVLVSNILSLKLSNCFGTDKESDATEKRNYYHAY